MVAFKASGVEPVELTEAPDLPIQAKHVWQWFCELGGKRTSSGFGLNPISYTELGHWMMLTHTKLEPWELRAINRLDSMFLKTCGSKKGDAK